INLIVGDYFKLKSHFVPVINDVLEVCKWFNNYSRTLGILHQQQSNGSGSSAKPIILILPVLTRWTSHYLAFSCLLDLEITLQQMLLDHTIHTDLLSCAEACSDAKQKAIVILSIIESPDFWNEMQM
ncbi:hypothetical protein BDQ17DRAFT_1249269, partial [Cyathus striatus]